MQHRSPSPGSRSIVGRLLIAALIGSVLGGCGRPDPIDRIMQLEDARNPGGGRLAAYLRDPSAGVRASACRAAGRIGTPDLFDVVEPLVVDPDPSVAEEAVFALGQIALGHPEMGPRLVQRLDPRSVDGLRVTEGIAREAAAALGKSAHAGARTPLLGLLHDPRPSVRGEAALALGALGRPVPIDPILALLGDPGGDVRLRAAHALSSTDDERVVVGVTTLLDDPDPGVRAQACRTLGLSPAARAVAADAVLALLGRGELDQRVQVAALIALGRLQETAALPELRRYVHALWPQVRASAAGALSAFPIELVEDDLVRLTEDPNPLVRLYATDALAQSSSLAARERLRTLVSDDRSRHVRLTAVRSLCRVDPSPTRLVASLHDADPGVRRAAVESIAIPVRDAGLRASLLAAVRDPDVAVATAAVLRLALPDGSGGPSPGSGESDILASLYRPGAAAPLKRALLATLITLPGLSPCRLVPFTTDPDYEVRTRAYRVALRLPRVPGQECRLPPAAVVMSRLRPLRAADPSPDVDELPRRAEVVVEGGRSFVIRLNCQGAPHTVSNFLRLAGMGYFDGMEIFEVAPDSVVVAGCPRGDGFGGPGYSIRCEINPMRFGRGTVGMRIAAPDDGGSQFFITLAPQPGLDGRCTAFGEVVQGMTLLDGLSVGSRISRIIIG